MTGDPKDAGETTSNRRPPSDEAMDPGRFHVGDELAGRFRIVRFLSSGGMGEVYEARDVVLRTLVALKTIRPQIANDEATMERFRREVVLARSVTHPNICRVFDIFRHTPAEGPPLTFLTMELVEGETLDERLRRTGPMTTAEALPIARQMLTALGAAHEAGIIHRDFKSANVLLTTASGSGGVRAVVSDFGLASGLAGDAAITATHELIGTPDYMAPEQVSGRVVTFSADLYAAGVVLFEMVTGSRPFTAESPLATAARRLDRDPPPPRRLRPGLDARWEKAILKLLERDPARRFRSAAAALRALETRGADRSPGEGAHGRFLFPLAVAFALAVVAAFALVVRLRPSQARPAATGRRSVAVLGLKNLSGRPTESWLSTALSEMLRAELAAGEKLRVVSGESVARATVELKLPEATSLAHDTLGKLRRILSADVVVLGSYLAGASGPRQEIRLDVRLQDTESGESLLSIVETGTGAELSELVSRIADRLRRRLGAETSALASARARAALSSDPETLRLYSEGLASLRAYDALSARRLLDAAAARDPDSALLHSVLSTALSRLGNDAASRDEAKKALDRSSSLPREEQLLVEGRYFSAIRAADKAIEIYRRLWGFFPDNLEYGLLLANAQATAEQGTEALATIEALRALPQPARDDPRIDLAEASAASALSDMKRRRTASARAAAKGTAIGARLLVAEARSREGSALHSLSEPEQAAVAYEEARRIFAELGDRNGEGRALQRMTELLVQQGDLARARTTSDEALGIYHRLGPSIGLVRSLWNAAEVQEALGDLDGVEASIAESGALLREIGRSKGEGVGQAGREAMLAFERGELAKAGAKLDEAAAILQGSGSRTSSWDLSFDRAVVLAATGGVGEARRVFEEARGLAVSGGEKSREASAGVRLGRVLVLEGSLADARKVLEDALAVTFALREKSSLVETRLELARLSIEEGKAAEAESLSRSAVEELERQRRPHLAAAAGAVLSDALLLRGDRSGARAALARAAGTGAASPFFEVRMEIALASARLDAADGENARAAQTLARALAEARRSGHEAFALECLLAIGEGELRAAPAAGHARLAALEKEASAKGYGLIARKAAALRANSA